MLVSWKWLIWTWLGLMAGCVVLSPTLPVLSNWHDQQRLFQLSLLTTSLVLLFCCPQLAQIVYKKGVLAPVLGFLSLGALSAAIDQAESAWAWLEVSWWSGHFALFICFASLAQKSIDDSKKFGGYIAASFCAAYGVGIAAGLASVYFQGAPFRSREIIWGFSNIRFFGQLSTLLFPLLVSMAVDNYYSRSSRFVFLSCATIMVFAMVVSQTRGTFYGLAAGLCILLYVARDPAWWNTLVVSIAAGGCLYLSLVALPGWMGWIDISGMELRYDNFGLSGRSQLWAQSWRMVREGPFFGSGPMGFAEVHHRLGAHPHSVVAQLASEWGIPALLIFVLVCLRGVWAIARKVRLAPSDPLGQGLLVALSAALTQSLVDGVFVMPLSQIVLVLVAAWAYAYAGSFGQGCAGVKGSLQYLGAVQLLTCIVLITIFSSLAVTAKADRNGFWDREQCHVWIGQLLHPRFWECGWIRF